MDSLLGDRFLRRFAGGIRRKQKHPTFITEDQHLDDADDEAVYPNKNAAEVIHEKDAADSPETRQSSEENSSEDANE